MSDSFQIAETENFSKKIKNFKSVHDKLLKYIYPQLRSNPFFGRNIKKLKGSFEGIYRYRTGKIRIFYTVEKNNGIIFMLDVDYRKDVYKGR